VPLSQPRGWDDPRVAFAILLTAAAFIVLLLTVDHGDANTDLFTGALLCGLALVVVGVILLQRILSRLVVDQHGVHVHLLRTRTIPWGQLEDVTIERQEGGLNRFRLWFVTPTGRILCDAPLVETTDAGQAWMRQLAVAIVAYRDRTLAGTPRWEPPVGDDASHAI
jgi:hypothetical protein